MTNIAPFSALNLYNSKPVQSVVSKIAPTQDDFAAERELQKKSADTFKISQANQTLSRAALFNPQSAQYAVQDLLQAQYLPAQESADLAAFASPSDQSKLALYKNLGSAQSTQSTLLDLLKV
ncbi:MAG: hypothetical protein EYC62_00710 [Alphaproteobacteria bacterium]|nr:MAG: hypothetical protein EYC62_00710 [Alphaproteobacteria bacterium]